MNGRRGPRPSCPSGSASAQARSPETQSPPKRKRRRKKRKRNKCFTRPDLNINDNSICQQTLLSQQDSNTYNFKNRDYVRSRLQPSDWKPKKDVTKKNCEKLSSPKKIKSK